MEKSFKISCTGHEKGARKLLFKMGIKTEKDLALMSCKEVEQVVNEKFEAIESEDDWLLIPKEKMAKFNEIVNWIER